MEEWKNGRLEEWKIGRQEEWEDWKIGKMGIMGITGRVLPLPPSRSASRPQCATTIQNALKFRVFCQIWRRAEDSTPYLLDFGLQVPEMRPTSGASGKGTACLCGGSTLRAGLSCGRFPGMPDSMKLCQNWLGFFEILM